MSGRRWQQVWEVFEMVIGLPPEARPAALEEACGQDEHLRRRVEKMLVADRRADSFLDHPIGRQPGSGRMLDLPPSGGTSGLPPSGGTWAAGETPRRRHGSVERLAAKVERHQLGPVAAARAGSWRYRARKLVLRNRGNVAALLVIGFIVATALQISRVSFERDQARRERDQKTQVLGLVLDLVELSNPNALPGKESHRASFGEEPDLDSLLGGLAGAQPVKGELDDAMRLYLEARQAVLDTAGPGHWGIYYCDLRIARARIRQGASAAARAEAELRHVIDLWRPELGDHWRIDEGLSVLGESISVQGRCVEAEPLLVDSFERMLGKTIVRARKGFLERLRDHFERCGEPREAARYAALLEDVLG